MVKLADCITNLQEPPSFWKPHKIQSYRTETMEILTTLGVASEALATRLRARIENYAQYGNPVNCA